VARSMPSSSHTSTEAMRSGVFVTALVLRHKTYLHKLVQASVCALR
jgi:hypothetical protein